MLIGRYVQRAAALVAVGVTPVHAAEPIVIIHAGTLLAVPGHAAKTRQTLVVRGGRVAAVKDGFLGADTMGMELPVEVIDLSHEFVLPGMIDLHVHLTTDTEPGEALRVVSRSAADLALVASHHARETVQAGFTTVLDLGTGRPQHDEAVRALKSAIAAGIAFGPRVLSAGSPIASTGSSRTGRFASEVEAVVGPDGICDGPQDCQREVREQVASGADVINLYNSGSIGDLHLVERTMTELEMRAVVETAHALGRRVVADGHTAAAINTALRAGADIIDTAPWPDEESFRLMRRQGVFLEPHMYAFVVSVQDLRSGSTTVPDSPDSPIVARLKSVLASPFSAQLAHERGVRLAYGSDTGIVRHGDNAGELAELVAIGLTPMQAIEVVTVNSAVAIGWSAEIGSLEPGKRADVIATGGDPLRDIAALRQVSFVMRDGHVLEHH